MTNRKIMIAVVSAAALALSALTASAQISIGDVKVGIKAHLEGEAAGGLRASTTVRADLKAQAQTQRTQNIISRGNQEIDRRIDALTKLSTRVGEMVKVSDSEKASIAAEVQDQISILGALKTKISGETDLDMLHTDVKSITDSYRIFMLIIPQGRILAAADRMKTIADSMTAIGVKLQMRITAAATAGKDVTALQTALTDLNAKLADAKVQADAAVTVVTGLTPDNGDQAKLQANQAALKQGRGDIQAGTKDLQAARADAQTIVNGLKTFHLDVTATSTTTI